MTRFTTAKILLVALTSGFIVAALYIAAVTVERQKALVRVAQYNVTWDAAWASVELLRLQQLLASYGNPDLAVDPQEVVLRHEILLNRARLLKERGQFRAFSDKRPERGATVDRFAAALDKVEPLVQRLDRANALAALATLSDLNRDMALLTSDAHHTSSAEVAAEKRELIGLHQLFSLLTAGLIACGFGLIALLVWQNHRLLGADRDLRRLNQSLADQSGQLAAANTELTDRNAALEESRQALAEQYRLFDAALNNMSQGLLMFDADRRVIVCNERYYEVYGLRPDAVRIGMPLRDVLSVVRPLCQTPPGGEEEVYAELIAPLVKGQSTQFARELCDGRTLLISQRLIPNGGWVVTFDDITERRRSEARIAHLATHDSLTGLPNRVLFRERLERGLAAVRRSGGALAVFCLDLDRFKNVNDALGHPVGDKLLRAAAARIESCLGPEDTVARLGGDEFVVLHTVSCGVDRVIALARDLVDCISAPYQIDGHHVLVGASVGIALAPGDAMDGDELIKAADMALYGAKEQGRGRFRFFEPAMDARSRARRLLEIDLREALQQRQFELHFQPLVELASGRIGSFEALLRWHHPERGMIPPAEFIPLAEEIGAINELGAWVIEAACRSAALWPADIKIAVNVSPAQFEDRGVIATVARALAESGLDPARLELEITESVLMQETEFKRATLYELRELGVGIALDDFGTGYSSLSYLRSFPFHKIKIDRSFVSELDKPDSLAIVRTIATLAETLGMRATAEGIERAEQIEFLRLAGCTEGQGYFFSRPVPLADAMRLLAGQGAARAVA